MSTIIIDGAGGQINEATGAPIPPQPSEHHTYDMALDQWVDARTLDDAKASAWERVKLARDAAEQADFACDGATYQADRERITGATQLALLAQLADAPYSIDWTLSDNSLRTLDAAGMIAVGAALGEHVAGVFAIGRDLREQIAAATTIEQLDAIQWPQEGA